ncbi:MAG: type VI secretion system baseplate subunit TssG, partial [Pirellula sp.]
MNVVTNESINELQPLIKRPQAYSFFQALREIEVAHPDLPRIGHAASPRHEAFRIGQPADLGFAPSTIDSVVNQGDRHLSIEQRFFGLLGPSGPLPIHLTEIVRNRNRHASDDTLQSFLDIFHHRMAVLFYRAWSSARPTTQRDRPSQDRFAIYISALAGLGLRNARHRDAWQDDSKQYFAGHLASSRRNAEGLQSILGELIAAPVSIKPFSLRWLTLANSDTTRIGVAKNSLAGHTNCLGKTAVLGRRVADRQSQFDVEIGPVTYDTYEKLLPGAPQRDVVQAVVRNYSGQSMDGCFRPLLRKDQVPRVKLGTLGRLGRNAW